MSNEQIRILAWASRPEHQKRWAALETIPGVGKPIVNRDLEWS